MGSDESHELKREPLVAIVTRDSRVLSRLDAEIVYYIHLYTLTRVSSFEFSLITISY